MQIKNTFSDLIHTKCPNCRDANMFKSKTLDFKNMLKMHHTCPSCKQDFMPEPGFYFGAMYISYGINVALMIFFGVACQVLFSPENVLITLASVFIPTIILVPWNFRISRAIMLYAFGNVERG